MNRVLIPTDFSANAYNALKYAKQLFAGTSTTFYLLHTYTPAVYRADYLLESPGQLGLGDVLMYNAEKNLNKVEKKITGEFPDLSHQFVLHTAFNTLTSEIKEMCQNEHIDLVIMGTQGATGAAEIFLGTHTVQAIKKLAVPLLVIPPDFTYKPLESILFPTDYEVEYNENNLRQLLYLIKHFKARLDVMHISTGLPASNVQQENKELLIKLLKSVTHRIHELPDQPLIPAIGEFMEDNSSDMLTMIRNKHSFFERLFIDPVISKIAFHTDQPFLVLPGNFNN